MAFHAADPACRRIDHGDVRHDHHRRRHVGPGRRHRLAYYDQRRLHPRAAHHDRRPELVLSPGRPQLRRRPARRHQFHPAGTKKGPLARCCASCGCSWDDFALVAADRLDDRVSRRDAASSATISSCSAPRSQRTFPAEIDNFNELVDKVVDYDDLDILPADRSAREVVSRDIRDPLLVEMLFCPLMFYGGAQRRRHGLRPVLDHVPQHLLRGPGPAAGRHAADPQEPGAQVQASWGANCGCGPASAGMAVAAGEVASGACWTTAASWPAHRRALVGRLVGDDADVRRRRRPTDRAGRPALVRRDASRRSTCQPRELGCDRTIVFFNDSDKFHWQKPDELVDVRSGVICSPNNFDYDEPLGEG